jgi:hypothetical protein
MPRPPKVAGRVVRPTAEQFARRPDVHVAALAARQWGVVSVAELRACGLSDDAIATRVRNAGLHPLHRGVYAVGHANPPVEGVFLAAVKACAPAGVLSHFSAAAAWAFVEWDGRLPEVTVRRSRTPRHPHLRAHRTTRLDERDISTWNNMPITSPARTIIDVAGQLSDGRLRRAVRQAQSLKLVSLEELADALRRYPRRRGIPRLARLIAASPAPTRSALEDLVLKLMLDGGLEHPDVNVPLVAGGRTVIPDFRWRGPRVVVEADGAAWHDHKLAREDDAERQALLEAHGERVVRITWNQAVARPSETLARLRAAGAPVKGELFGGQPNKSPGNAGA